MSALPSSSDSWEDGLPKAARTLRNLLRDVDSACAPLWMGSQLDAARYRYTEIFLPMLAAHLGAADTNSDINELQQTDGDIKACGAQCSM